jgi:signal transduction histidine kinase
MSPSDIFGAEKEMNLIDFLFDASNWPARWNCGHWTASLGWIHIISDISIFLAYISIPTVLIYWCIKRRDIPFNHLLVLFALFIVFCGSGHLVEAIIFWHPIYRFDALVKLSTGIISWVTVLALLPVIPKVLDLPKLEKLNQILNRDLLVSKKRLELSFQGSDVGLWDWDITTNQITFSSFFLHLMGQPSDSLEKSYDEFLRYIHAEDQENFKVQIKNHLEKRLEFQCKLRMKVKDKYRWFHGRGLAYWDDAGKPIRMAGSLIDIQDMIDTHEKLSTTVEDLKTANKEMENFLYVVSHDLRAPLINIKGFSGELEHAFSDLRPLLEKGSVDSSMANYKEEVPQALKFISGSVQKIDYLIEALLRLSRIGRTELVFEELDTRKIVDEQVLALSHQLKSGNFEVIVSDLPKIVADKTAMQQIFANLLDNACKYRDHNRNGKIEIYCEKLCDFTRFHVKDNGLGIRKEDISKVFEIFKRIDPVSTPGEGMGLAYLKKLIRLHRGDIDFTSTFGVGSDFYFTIPHNLKAAAPSSRLITNTRQLDALGEVHA